MTPTPEIEPDADDVKPKPAQKQRKASAKDDVHSLALKRYEAAYNKDRENILAALDDLNFCVPENQWDVFARNARIGRPQLSVDKTAQFVRQVTGDIRQMRPAIKVVPVDERGNREIAEKIMPGMIRYIEQRSDAPAAYFNAADSQVRAGIGHWRVMTEYSGTDTFLQELRIAPIEDGVSVLWDPDAVLPTREDAMWCHVPVDLSRAAFEERYPGKQSGSLDRSSPVFVEWSSGDKVRVSEYWLKEPIKRTLAMLPGGGIDDVTDDKVGEANALAIGARIETRDDFKVVRYLLSAGDILEGPDKWPGRLIPIVPLIGEEIKAAGKVIRRGVVRPLKDVQRLYNYTISQDVEIKALQPKAPWIGTKKNFADTIDDWETANIENHPFLEYVPDEKNGGQAPQRVAPPVNSSGLAETLERATADMSAITGIYPSSLGAASNESSGRAIIARQREGDTGTYLYVDNFARAIRYTGKILIDAIPHVYDTQRTIRIVGEDGKVDLVQINQAQTVDGIENTILNDVTVGTYDIAIEMGPSYSTKREEARDGMATLMQSLGPNSMLFADLFASQQDWPLADKIAKRLKFTLPPPIQQMEAAESGEPPPPMPPPPPPPPELQMKAAQEQRQSEIDQLKAQAALASVQNEILKNQIIFAQLQAPQPEAAPAAPVEDTAKVEQEGRKLDIDRLKAQRELAATETERLKAENERVKAENERLRTKVELAKLTSPQPEIDRANAAAQQAKQPDPAEAMQSVIKPIGEAVAQLNEGIRSLSNVTNLTHIAVTSPRRTKLVRDPVTGKATESVSTIDGIE